MLRDPEIETGSGLQPGAVPDAQKTRLEKGFPFHPVLFAGLYVLTSFQQIYPFGSFAELLKYLLPLLLVVFAAQLLVFRIYPHPFKVALLLTLFIVPFCFFGDARMQLEKVLVDTRWIEFTRLRFFLVFVVAVSMVLAALIIFTRRNLFSLSKYLNVLSAVLVVATIAQMIMTPRVEAVAGGEESRRPLTLPANPPDVYYILMDAYTSPESLQRYWNYDNSPFTDFLKENGFQVLKDARGNADFSPRCMATTLNMSYPPALPPRFSLPAQVKYFCNIIEEAEAPARLKASGYKITALSLFATAGEPRFYQFPIIGSTTFGEYLFTKTVAGYLNSFRKRTVQGDTNLEIFSRLSEIAKARSEHPRFVYAHLLMPHEPFYFDRHGNRVMRGMSEGTVTKEDYLEQLIYANKLLTNAVTDILKHSKTPPIIIIQGDHGFRNLPLEHRKEESTTILNALHLPGAEEDWIYEGITSVNTFRLVFNRYFGASYEYLPDKQNFYLRAEAK